MIAPPGAGKGTQGALIAVHFGISTSRPVNCCAITSRVGDGNGGGMDNVMPGVFA